MKNWISNNDWTWLEYNIGGWNAGAGMAAEARPESS